MAKGDCIVKRYLVLILSLVLLTCAGLARAGHRFQIVELYSNADGTVQFVLLHEPQGLNGQHEFAGAALTATHAGQARTVLFLRNLPSTATANRYVLIATDGYVQLQSSLAEFAHVPADLVMPNQFLPTDGGTVNFGDVDEVTYTALPIDGVLALYTPGIPANAYVDVNEVVNFSGAFDTLPELAVTAVEYYNVALDHFFITNLQPDIAALDSGRIPGWSRTGEKFFVWAAPNTGLNPVCRFYIPPEHGNSHFFSASVDECAKIADMSRYEPNYSGYVLETTEAFDIALPDTRNGACPSGTGPVYRLWNRRADSNHRYTTNPAVKAQMQSRGYVAEGYGGDAVAMCSPR